MFLKGLAGEQVPNESYPVFLLEMVQDHTAVKEKGLYCAFLKKKKETFHIVDMNLAGREPWQVDMRDTM